jgi:predicted lipoprotein
VSHVAREFRNPSDGHDCLQSESRSLGSGMTAKVGNSRLRGIVAISLSLVLAHSLSACRLVPTAEVAAVGARTGASGAPAFDPDKMAVDMWQPKVIPYLEKKAGPFAEVRALAGKSLDDAGQRYGYRSKAGDAPWTFVARIEGRIVGADLESRAATIGIDVDGDGKADATVQIGPAIRGTALRDALDFVSFNDFVNQIDFARFGKSLNTLVDRTLLSALPRDGLVGRQASVLGAFSLARPDDPVLMTPAEISIGPRS